MLQSLHIQNYALIDQLDIEFESGFSVITGETGSGKSIMLGALALLLGGRADTKALRMGATKCVIEATFLIGEYGLENFFNENEIDYSPECIVRREIYASGKSRAFVNDTPEPLSVMRALGNRLVDIHSQHQNLLLNNESFQTDVLDTLAADHVELQAYHELYRQYTAARRDLEQLVERAAKARSDEEYLRFRLKQLEEASLKAGEQETLEQESDLLTHAEEIKAALYRASQTLDADEGSTLAALKDCLGSLRSVSRVYPPAIELTERMESAYIELNDIAHELTNAEEDVEFNPERLQEVNDRLSLIYSLQQKHHVNSVDDLLALQRELTAQLSDIDMADEQIEEGKARVSTLYNKVKAQAAVLTTARTAAARQIEEQMMARLTCLGMPHARFLTELRPATEPGPNGMDEVCFLFSANKNGVPQPVATVASGGEIARVMLSLKAMIARAVQLPTIIFDEIDAGVSGEMADRMADIMHEMGTGDRQVISITHLPQIAARGSVHYKVYKQDNDRETNSHIRRLTSEERVGEVAQMLSGATLTEAALSNARALLRLA